VWVVGELMRDLWLSLTWGANMVWCGSFHSMQSCQDFSTLPSSVVVSSSPACELSSLLSLGFGSRLRWADVCVWQQVGVEHTEHLRILWNERHPRYSCLAKTTASTHLAIQLDYGAN